MTERENVEDVIERHWPYDGPRTQDSVVDAASAISSLTRYLNNATQPVYADRTLEWGTTIYRVLGHLHSTVARFDQLLDQLGDAAVKLPDDPTSYDDRRVHPDRRGPVVDTAERTAGHVEAARQALAAVAHHLEAATSQAVHLGND